MCQKKGKKGGREGKREEEEKGKKDREEIAFAPMPGVTAGGRARFARFLNCENSFRRRIFENCARDP